MALLITLIFLNVMEVVSSENNGAVHLGADNLSRQNASSDGHVSSEWALFINVFSLDCLLWGLESQTYLLVPPISCLSWDLGSLASSLFVSAPRQNIAFRTSIYPIQRRFSKRDRIMTRR